jgi:hypothetical protein
LPSPTPRSSGNVVAGGGAVAGTHPSQADDVAAAPRQNAPVLIELLAEEASLLELYGVNHPKVKSIRARISAFQIEAGVETPLSRLQAEEKTLLQTYGPKHPKILSIRSQIDALLEESKSSEEPAAAGRAAPPPTMPPTKTAMASPFGPERPTSSPSGKPSPRSIEPPIVPTTAEAPDQDPAARLKELNDLTRRIAERRSELADLSEWNSLEAALRRELDDARQKYDDAESRFVAAEKARPKRGHSLVVLSEPNNGTAVARSLPTPLLIGAFVGALLGLVPLGGSTVKRRASPRAAASETPPTVRLPPPQDSLAAAVAGGIPAWLVVHYRPQSYEANIYRSLRTSLRFAGDGSDRCFAVFCTAPSDDARIIAANLAAAFALADRKTLLVDDLPGGSSATKLPASSAASATTEPVLGRPVLKSAPLDTAVPRLAVADAAADAHLASPGDWECFSDEVRRDFDVAVYCTGSLSRIRTLAQAGLHAAAIVLSPSTESDEALADKLAEYSSALDGPAVTIVKYDLSPA